ncbi:MAG TPA: hypothetical protein VFY79_10925 [Dehalococcoidia bacterium]|nr:hypothetical protein [Dehalococcoidia bacterium]
MANDSVSVAVAEVDDTGHESEEDQPKKGGLLGLMRGNKDDEEDADHEIEFSTPFGRFELEFEPRSKKERRDRKKREQRERDAAKKAADLALKARQQAEQALTKREGGKDKKGGGLLGKLVLALVIFALIGGAIAVAYWLFGRRPEELEAENVPPEYRAVDVEIASVEPAGFVPKIRERLRRAVRAGRRASMEAQMEQQARYEDLTRGG